MGYFRELYNYRDMLKSMVRRDIRGRYKASVLGVLWNFILPLVQTLVYIAVFNTLFNNEIHNYPIYLISGMVLWIWFSEALTDGAGVFVTNSELLKKIYFPRAVLPISTIISKMVNFMIMIGLLFIVMAFMKHPFTINILYVPVLIIITFAFLLGIVLILSAMNVFFRDVQYIVTALLMALIWIAPIMYMPRQMGGIIGQLISLNPITHFVNMYHDVFYYGIAPEINNIIDCTVIALIFLAIGVIVFRYLERDFAEVL